MNPLLGIKILKSDYETYAKECLHIETKKGTLEPFVFNNCQKHLWKIIKQDLIDKKPIRYIILKARQLGMSTFIQGLAHWFTSLNKHRGALVIGQDKDAAENLFQKQTIFYENLPNEVKPALRISNKKELHFASPKNRATLDGGLDSRILTQTAEKEGLGRSFTIHLAHLTEVGFWENLGYDLEKRLIALYSAIPYLPATFSFLETTANGDGFFKQLWDNDTNHKKIFISWVSDDQYTLPCNGQYFELSSSDDAQYGDEIQEYEYIKKELEFWYSHLVEDIFELNKEIYNRLNWRRFAIDNLCMGKLQYFQQEYPTIPEQAFLMTSSNLFDANMLNKMEKSCDQSYTFAYDDSVTEQLDLVIKNKALLQTICYNGFIQDDFGHLEIFEPPKDRTTYVIGADTSEGIKGGDFSSAVVLKLPNLVEVATFNQIVSPDIFATILFCLGNIYNSAMLAVEDNDRGGFAVIRLLQRSLFYSNLYRRKSFETVEGFKEVDKIGWKTTSKTKPQMIWDLADSIRNGEIKFNSKETIKQLRLFKLFDDGRTGVALPNHDDIAIAAMIAYQVSKFNIPSQKVNNIYPNSGKLTMKGLKTLVENKNSRGTSKGLSLYG